MNLLVTAGNTQVMIDRVRCLTNIFTGRTGAAIALAACERGHRVALLTSQPETVHGAGASASWQERGETFAYRTFDDLQELMARFVAGGNYQGIIHAAAVSDYLAAGVYALAPSTRFAAEDGTWRADGLPARLVDRAAGKVKSDEPELWLRLTRSPKLVDRIRTDWNFRGTLVKFKLEVGVTEPQLLEIAERSRRQSQADWMVANTLEGAAAWAYLGPFADGYRKIGRRQLPTALLDAVEAKKNKE
jgi:phosphopantothenoylcysteine synthetase/decarboxylase